MFCDGHRCTILSPKDEKWEGEREKSRSNELFDCFFLECDRNKDKILKTKSSLQK